MGGAVGWDEVDVTGLCPLSLVCRLGAGVCGLGGAISDASNIATQKTSDITQVLCI